MAQHTVSGTLPPVEKDGYYRILLDQKLRAWSQSDLADFRILDGAIEVPYLLVYPGEARASEDLVTYPMIERKQVAGKHSSFLFRTDGRQREDTWLSVAPTSLVKTFSISGSDDRRNWFGLLQDQILSWNGKDGMVRFRLPPNQYRYLKVTFDDRKTLPAEVLSMGYPVARPSQPITMEPVVPKKMDVTQSGETTRIAFSLGSRHQIDALEVLVNTKGFYDRDARIALTPVAGKQRPSVVAKFRLASQTAGQRIPVSVNRKEFVLEIDNGDSPPLQIGAIRLYQKPVWALAFLEGGKTYVVRSGDSKARMPHYDLARMDAKNFPAPTELQIAELNKRKVTPKVSPEISVWQHPLFMWGCIGVGILVIGWVTFGLLKDLGKKD